MKKCLAVLLVGILSISIIACVERKFNGNRTSNKVQFIVDFSYLNDTKTHKMTLEKNDIIDVSFKKVSGRVDLIVEDVDGNEIYRGNDANSIEFQLTIPKSTTYKFSVIGRKAKGEVSFILKSN